MGTNRTNPRASVGFCWHAFRHCIFTLHTISPLQLSRLTSNQLHCPYQPLLDLTNPNSSRCHRHNRTINRPTVPLTPTIYPHIWQLPPVLYCTHLGLRYCNTILITNNSGSDYSPGSEPCTSTLGPLTDLWPPTPPPVLIVILVLKSILCSCIPNHVLNPLSCPSATEQC